MGGGTPRHPGYRGDQLETVRTSPKPAKGRRSERCRRVRSIFIRLGLSFDCRGRVRIPVLPEPRPDPAPRRSAQELVDPRGGLVSLGIGAALGYLAAGTPWLLLPIAVLLITVFGELQRWLIRRRCRGAAPVAVETLGWCGGSPIRRPISRSRVLRSERPILARAALRIAYVSDLHLNSHLPKAYYERVMHRVADAQPDLIFFTGDFVTDPQYVNLLPGVLAAACGRLGTFGVLGNHDYWADPAAVAATVSATGVTLLRDVAVRVPIGEGRHILIAGCESPWSSPTPPPIARPAPGELALMLTHTPDNVYRLSRLGYAAIFAGHYHGGQIRVPGLGSSWYHRNTDGASTTDISSSTTHTCS